MEYLAGERRVNAVIFAVSVVAYVVTFVDTSDRAWLPLLVPVALFGARVLEPRIPAWVVLVATTGVVVAVNRDLAAEGAFFLIVLAAFATTAAGARWIPEYVLILVAAASPIPIALSDIPADEWNWPFWSMGTIMAAFFGGVVAHQRALTQALTEAQTKLADQAAAEERRRIARDVHDLVGHSLTVVLLHVTGARRLARRDPEETERALEEAERAGRSALAEIRRTVTLLREEGDARAPTPTGQDLQTLVDESRAAGMMIVDDLPTNTAALDETTGLATYRIVQEALANAARHAPGSATDVTVRYTSTDVEIDITNTAPTSPAPPTSGGGNGVVGMHERATALGGTLTAGPAGTGGWRVTAVLPRETNDGTDS